jgi:hypothetical protein
MYKRINKSTLIRTSNFVLSINPFVKENFFLKEKAGYRAGLIILADIGLFNGGITKLLPTY